MNIKRFMIRAWLRFSTPREVERRLRRFGMSQSQAKRAIHNAKVAADDSPA